jgi:hypothetical protein
MSVCALQTVERAAAAQHSMLRLADARLSDADTKASKLRGALMAAPHNLSDTEVRPLSGSLLLITCISCSAMRCVFSKSLPALLRLIRKLLKLKQPWLL